MDKYDRIKIFFFITLIELLSLAWWLLADETINTLVGLLVGIELLEGMLLNFQPTSIYLELYDGARFNLYVLRISIWFASGFIVGYQLFES